MFQTLLVPLDGSPFSAKALPVATALAKRTGASLHVVTVLDPSAVRALRAGRGAGPGHGYRRARGAPRRRSGGDRCGRGHRPAGRGRHGYRAACSRAPWWRRWPSYADEIGADLVVMTTHGRSGLERLWLGSVAMSFLHRAPCPVYLVRPAGDDRSRSGDPAAHRAHAHAARRHQRSPTRSSRAPPSSRAVARRADLALHRGHPRAPFRWRRSERRRCSPTTPT